MLLICVRHGQSKFNAEGRIQGQQNTPLSELGLAQAQAIAAALAREPIDAVFSSPLDRALATARPTADALGLPVRVEPRLQEINAGIFQGLLWSEIEALHPDEGRRWRAHDPDFIVPGGESRRQLMARGRAAFDAIRAAGPFDRVAVFTHGGVLGAAFKALLAIPAEQSPFGFYNGSINRLRWDSIVKLVTLNETEHLRVAGVEQVDRTGDL